MSDTPVLSPAFAGVDVGKSTLQLAILRGDGRFLEQVFANSNQGCVDLAGSCARHGVKLVVLEATGGLELDVACELAHQQVAVSVVTPAQSKAFARALNQQAKTDAIDARLLALFAARLGPQPTQIPSDTQRSLRELAARRRQLMQQLVQEKNRSGQARDKRVAASIAKAVAFLEQQLADIDQHLGQLIAADAVLQETVVRLDSVPSIGPGTAAQLVIACPELGTLNRQQIASLAGLAPFNHDSGTASGQRHIRGGRTAIRNALYMATLAALRFNPVIREHYQERVKKGKHKMVALIAAMRKLLIILNSMVREKKTWKEFLGEAS